ncbi:hypothetical protein BJ508DRAFT_311394 [Ascobolus immersus RN42]|uniref:Uncharacterized protein n=1 Tax=Ascobolus immersus RN42 TaxID=1160509 RepID=A0A3N4I2H9_ASCIM|nr:hypothetical protein BJ508DRAFT_311394 [Ascobolus immersus RN42]
MTKVPLYTVPAEIRLQILCSIDSYDALCTTISAFPKSVFFRVFSESPRTVLNALLHNEMDGREHSEMGGSSTLIHALQLACMPIFGLESSYPVHRSPSETQETIFQFYQKARSVRKEKKAKDELEFWLRELTSAQMQAIQGSNCISEPAMPLVLSDETISFLLSMHYDASSIFRHFVADVLPKVTLERLGTCSIGNHPCVPWPVSFAERSRIFFAIYGLYFAVDVDRLRDVRINICESESDRWSLLGLDADSLIWCAYDNIWQLEWISTLFSYLCSRLTEPILQLRAKLWAEEKQTKKCSPEYFMDSRLDPQDKYGTDAKFVIRLSGQLAEKHGIRELWQRYGRGAQSLIGDGRSGECEREQDCGAARVEYMDTRGDRSKRARLSRARAVVPWPSPAGVQLLMQTPKTSLNYFTSLKNLLLPDDYADDSFESNRRSFRFGDDVRPRALEVCGDKSRHLDKYYPERRIADVDWSRFTEYSVQSWWRYSSEGGLRFDLAIWDEARLSGWGFKMPVPLGYPDDYSYDSSSSMDDYLDGYSSWDDYLDGYLGDISEWFNVIVYTYF